MEGTQARARASTRGHSFSADPFGLRDSCSFGAPRLPARPFTDLDGKEGADGSNPLEGFTKASKWPFVFLDRDTGSLRLPKPVPEVPG